MEGYCAENVGCHDTLQVNIKWINPRLYCVDCQKLPTAAGPMGYVLLDMHDPANLRVYPVGSGARYSIWDITLPCSRMLSPVRWS